MINAEKAREISVREAAYEKARKAFDPIRYRRGGGYTKEDVKAIEQAAGIKQPTNEERGKLEEYEWMTYPPKRAFLYYNEDITKVTGWTGIVFGRIVWKGTIQRRFGGTRTQAVNVRGTNGFNYHGNCNLDTGTYCRLKMSKKQQ